MSALRRGFCAALLSTVLPLVSAAQNAPADSFPDRTGAFGGVPFGATLEDAKKSSQLEFVEGASVSEDPVAHSRSITGRYRAGQSGRDGVHYTGAAGRTWARGVYAKFIDAVKTLSLAPHATGP